MRDQTAPEGEVFTAFLSPEERLDQEKLRHEFFNAVARFQNGLGEKDNYLVSLLETAKNKIFWRGNERLTMEFLEEICLTHVKYLNDEGKNCALPYLRSALRTATSNRNAANNGNAENNGVGLNLEHD